MFWNVPDRYSEFLATSNNFENPLSVDVRVDPALNGNANILSVYTGTAILNELFFRNGASLSSAWCRGILRFNVPTPDRIWTSNTDPIIPTPLSPEAYFISGTVLLSLGSIFNRNVANNTGWAIDGADVSPLSNKDRGLEVTAALAIRDTDAYLLRIGYQVTVLGTVA